MIALGAGGGISLALVGGGGGGDASSSGSLDLHPVAGSFKPDGTRLAACGADRACLEQAFGNLAYYKSPKNALRVFRERMATDPAVESGCHRIAHIIGSASLARYHGNVPEAFAQGDSTCWSGYYHGILERSFQGVRTATGFTNMARSVCSGAELRRSLWLTYQCVHGLGHGLMIQTGYNLPFSLGICEKLAAEWDRSSCTGGIFMENISAGQTSAYGVKSPWLRDNDPVYPCDSPVVKGRELYCYLMVTSHVLQTNGNDWQATAKVCARVASAWVRTCFESYGRDADGQTRQNPTEVRRLCRLAGPNERDCLYGAARDMTSNYSNGTRASILCRTERAGLRAYCFRGIGTVLGTISTDEPGRRHACAEVTPSRYLADCLRGAGVLA